MGVSGVDSSAAGWAQAALGAAEAYTDAQAEAAANASAQNNQPTPAPNDGVEPSSWAEQSAQNAFWGSDPNRPSTNAPSPSSSSAAFVTPQEAQLLQQAGFTVHTNDQGQHYVPAQGGNDVHGPSPPSSWAPLAGPGSAPVTVTTSPTSAPPAQETSASPVNTNPSAGVGPSEDAGAPPEHKEIRSGLGAEVDATLNLSPTLRRLVEQARAAGWRIEIGRSDERSNANAQNKRIYLNLNNMRPDGDQIAKMASMLAHEVGHAANPRGEDLRPANRKDYVDRNVALSLRAEGSAAFENARARDEILAAGGRDIGIRGGLDDEYIAVYEDFKSGRISEPEAKLRMGEIQGREYEPEFGTRKAGFAHEFGQAWDEAKAEQSRQTGSP
ncbi:MAG TPA: hypothetical protein VGF45_09515 [Polyangia bacterium]